MHSSRRAASDLGVAPAQRLRPVVGDLGRERRAHECRPSRSNPRSRSAAARGWGTGSTKPDERAVAVDGDGVEVSETHPGAGAGRPRRDPRRSGGPAGGGRCRRPTNRPSRTARSFRVSRVPPQVGERQVACRRWPRRRPGRAGAAPARRSDRPPRVCRRRSCPCASRITSPISDWSGTVVKKPVSTKTLTAGACGELRRRPGGAALRSARTSRRAGDRRAGEEPELRDRLLDLADRVAGGEVDRRARCGRRV